MTYISQVQNNEGQTPTRNQQFLLPQIVFKDECSFTLNFILCDISAIKLHVGGSLQTTNDPTRYTSPSGNYIPTDFELSFY